MQKWEYFYIRITPSTDNSQVVMVDGKKLDYKDFFVTSSYLNKLGEEGWELVATGKEGYLFFKRPKPDSE